MVWHILPGIYDLYFTAKQVFLHTSYVAILRVLNHVQHTFNEIKCYYYYYHYYLVVVVVVVLMLILIIIVIIIIILIRAYLDSVTVSKRGESFSI